MRHFHSAARLMTCSAKGSRCLHRVPSQFRDGAFSRPSSLEECLSILAENSHARVVAGGTDLGVEFNLKGKRFASLVSG